MYHVSAQGVDERIINVHYYYYYYSTEEKAELGRRRSKRRIKKAKVTGPKIPPQGTSLTTTTFLHTAHLLSVTSGARAATLIGPGVGARAGPFP